MAKLELTNKQLRLIQTALDLYARIGILQFEEILRHPTIEQGVEDRFRSHKKLEVGDKTDRGEIVEITKKHIKTKGRWNGEEEVKTWKDIENIKLSTDWTSVHKTNDDAADLLAEVKRLVSGESYGRNASYGIHNPKVDTSCRDAFDIVQVIRHEFWKADPKKSNMTVDSHVHIIGSCNLPKAEIDVEEYLNEIKKWQAQ
jgi:hypothetical protein